MTLDRRAALRGWRSFSGIGAGGQAFLLARLAIIPLGALDGELRALRGDVLSVGCGHGVLERYLSEINPDVKIVGAELDADRVAAAADTGAGYPRLTIVEGDARRLDALGVYDAVLTVDLVHHVPRDDHGAVAAAVFEHLRPGGVWLVKEMDVRPRWKWTWNRLHDRLVARQWVECRSPEDLAAVAEGAGFVLERSEHVDRRYGPYPQYLLRLRRP